jgi:DNA-binding MarR family transcriptional regulator
MMNGSSDLGKAHISASAQAPHDASQATANGAWEALMAAHASLLRRFAADDVWEDMSLKEYDVLYALSKCHGPARIGELNAAVLLSQPALSRLVDRLAADGLVRRVPDPSDGRGVRVELTEAGRDTQRRIGGRHGREVSRALRSRLTAEELALLREICAKLAE